LCAAPLRPDDASGPPSGPPTDLPSLTTTIDPIARGLLAGSVVAGKYRILGEIGRGGMGIVYEADDIKLRRPVALKFLPAELTDDLEARERFVHEAQAASVLDDPHICTIHEIGESEDGRMFIAMALCHGESLKAKIRRGPLPPAEALSLAAQVAAGLAAAHAAGIVHRDVKPANILVSKEGQARIADFGLAKIAGEARLTQAGRAVGTVAYMSPEQLRGEDVDARSDVWSLGIVVYEMLTGELPFRGTTEHSLGYAIVNSEPKPLDNLPPGTPAGCTGILERALVKAPAARFASAAEMGEAIAEVRAAAGYSSRLRTPSRTADGLRAETPVPRPLLLRLGLPALGVAAALSLAFALGLPRRLAVLIGLAPSAPAARHISVFPPSVVGGSGASGPDMELAAGLAEYLRLRLDGIARRTRSWVTPVDHFEGYGVHEASDALSVLGSNVVLSGTFKRAGDNITLALDVLDPASFRRLGTVSTSDHIANIATWQADLVLSAAAALGLETEPAADSASLSASGTTVPGAFEAYVRGLGAMTSVYTGLGRGDPAMAQALASAVSAFEDAVRLDPSFAAARIELADALRRRSAPGTDGPAANEAVAVIRDVLKSSPDLAQAHYVLGAILHALGKNEEAIAELERAISLDPLYYDAHIRLGTYYEDTSRPAKAEAAYRAALRVRPGYWAGTSYLGLFFFYQGAFDKARDEYERAVRACPGNSNLLNNLGAVHFKMGDFDRAVGAFERSNAVKRNPDATSNLAVLYYYTGRYADAVTMNEAAMGQGESEAGHLIWGNLADAYHFTPGNRAKEAEAYRKAIELAERVLAADPGDARTHGVLSVFLAKTGDGPRARTEIEGARRVMPDDNTLALKAVLVYELTGDRPKALAAVRDYVRLKGPMDEIALDPFLAGLRQDPAFLEIVKSKPAGAP
jgi:serine/threonine-protein kinase